jgi:hypothetical protein
MPKIIEDVDNEYFDLESMDEKLSLLLAPVYAEDKLCPKCAIEYLATIVGSATVNMLFHGMIHGFPREETDNFIVHMQREISLALLAAHNTITPNPSEGSVH